MGALPSPVEPKAFPMPAEEGLGFDDGQCCAPIEEPGQSDHSQAGRWGSPSWFRFAFLKQGQLPAQEEILRDQSGAVGKQQSNEGEQSAF